jgi:hypothetical protein
MSTKGQHMLQRRHRLLRLPTSGACFFVLRIPNPNGRKQKALGAGSSVGLCLERMHLGVYAAPRTPCGAAALFG